MDERRNGAPETSPTKPSREDSKNILESRGSGEADKQDHSSRERGASNSSVNGVNGVNGTITQPPKFEPQRGYKQWVAQAGTLGKPSNSCLAVAQKLILKQLRIC